jgi:hypothetical protein
MTALRSRCLSTLCLVGFLCTTLLALGGCSEHVSFDSRPHGAKVYVGDVYVGETPTIYSTRDVVSRSYRVEKPGYPEAVGTLQARVAPGRIIGAIFTLGILAAARPMLYFDPDDIDVELDRNADGSVVSMAADAKLYNLKSNEVAMGGCDARGNCTVTFPSGVECNGESVRENQGTTTTAAGSGAHSGYAYGRGAYAGGSAIAATGRETQNSQRGVTMFRCPSNLIDCAMVLDAFGAGGHGDCKDGRGTEYRLMLIPK